MGSGFKVESRPDNLKRHAFPVRPPVFSTGVYVYCLFLVFFVFVLEACSPTVRNTGVDSSVGFYSVHHQCVLQKKAENHYGSTWYVRMGVEIKNSLHCG